MNATTVAHIPSDMAVGTPPAPPDVARRLWDNSNIVESYGGVTTPLTFSFVSEVYGHVYREFCRTVGVPQSQLDDASDAFDNMLGLIQGRLYYNLGHWYQVLALLPGFTLNSRYMESMMGVQQAAPEWVLAAARRPSGTTTARDLVNVARAVAHLARHALTVQRLVRRFRARLDDALKTPATSLEEMTADELVGHYRALRRQLLLAWDAPIVNDFLAMVSHGVLRSVTRRWLDDRDGALANEMLRGQGAMPSTEPAALLQRLAQLAAGDRELLDGLVRGTPGAVQALLAQRPLFGAEYRRYLARFGDRTMHELKLETLTLHDDPAPLHRAIVHLAGRSAEPDRLSAPAVRQSPVGGPSRTGVTARLRAGVARHVARRASARLRDRELLRFDRTHLFGRIRRIFVELGRRLHAAGALRQPRDVFYLTVSEVITFVEGRSVSTALHLVVDARRQEFAAFEQQPAPLPRFETQGLVYQDRAWVASSRTPGGTSDRGTQVDDERNGIGCSHGRVRGCVRLVHDPADAVGCEPAILVATHTDPGWVLLFPSAIAVIAERGSLLSHTAIVARELGIPAVVSLTGATQWLEDGDVVEVDGDSGLVRRLAARTDSVVRHETAC